MIRFQYLTKNDGQQSVELSAPASPMRRVLSPFRRRRSMEHQAPEKVRTNECPVEDPHLGKTVDVSHLDDNQEDHSLVQLPKPSTEFDIKASSTHKITATPQKVTVAPLKVESPPQNPHESSLSRLTRSINALLHRSDTSTSSRGQEAPTSPSKRRIGRRKSLLGTIGEKTASLTDQITKPSRRASMGSMPGKSSPLSSLSSVGSMSASPSDATSIAGRRAGPLDDLMALISGEDDETDHYEELLGNSEHVCFPRTSSATPRIVTIHQQDKQTRNEAEIMAAVLESPTITWERKLSTPPPPKNAKCSGMPLAPLTPSPRAHCESNDDGIVAMSPQPRTRCPERRQASRRRSHRKELQSSSSIASASVLSSTKKIRAEPAGETKNATTEKSSASPKTPRSPVKTKLTSSRTRLPSHGAKSPISRQNSPRRSRQRIESSMEASPTESPKFANGKHRTQTGQPKRSSTYKKRPKSPRKDSRMDSDKARPLHLAVVPDLELAGKTTKASESVSSTKTPTKRPMPRRSASLLNLTGHEQEQDSTGLERQRKPPRRKWSMSDMPRRHSLSEVVGSPNQVIDSPNVMNLERLKPSFSSTSWGDPSFEPLKLHDSASNFISPYSTGKGVVRESPMSSAHSSVSWGYIASPPSSPSKRTDSSSPYTTNSAGLKHDKYTSESPLPRRGDASFASTPWGELSLSRIADPALAKELSQAVEASLIENDQTVAIKPARHGKTRKQRKAPSRGQSQPKVLTSPPQEARTLLSPYRIATQRRNDDSSASSDSKHALM